jgi:hypothetical protein
MIETDLLSIVQLVKAWGSLGLDQCGKPAFRVSARPAGPHVVAPGCRSLV